MAFTKKNEEAVSPVIGVILMVAITVILAAVIAAFVFGMAGNIQKTKVVATTIARPNSSGVIVTYQGGQDAGSLQGLAFTVNGANLTTTTGSQGSTGGWAWNGNSQINTASGNTLPIGSSVFFKAPTSSQVVILGVFNDGTTQVLLQQTI
jgi:flagellin-like protein